MSEYCNVQLAGAELWLLAEKAVYWPEHKALLIADAHFGKAAAYRKLGQPVPHGTTASNLQVIDRILEKYPTEHLIFLGDFLHAPGSHSAGTLDALAAWRTDVADLRITLIRGNHDKRAGDPPAELRFEVVTEPLEMGPFALQHEPDPHPELHVLAGHIHPVYRLHGRGRQSLRLPCYLLRGKVSLLPAFGAFTGGYNMDSAADQRVYVVGDGGVWRVA
ncbi:MULTISPECIES: ligase-associated DNA damage response endonuclease PdeM [Pseudomonas]|uniref:Ligase-associated DNA damage response endonuclease PdeM n=1 Tax=Pseudomonas baltica TaxID=2762576 RepID=A0A7X1KTJ4_9PSED|nr:MULTISPECIES: ligase-associated DNA damage response endonuclease PdeM [Pseudomonas]MBC2678779.1 ligase-associated DNA damage response endonuclease PdeM [Pseudomonas baltica]MBD8592035.1 ligase-associated DNA damage response endonuclease PdeM [Pseudomonas sp. CFBP 8758]MBD8622913.1 ligase-associated DNA damage response endonuclease PdeM [Pseudomonas sp. CFBP 13727]